MKAKRKNKPKKEDWVNSRLLPVSPSDALGGLFFYHPINIWEWEAKIFIKNNTFKFTNNSI